MSLIRTLIGAYLFQLAAKIDPADVDYDLPEDTDEDRDRENPYLIDEESHLMETMIRGLVDSAGMTAGTSVTRAFSAVRTILLGAVQTMGNDMDPSHWKGTAFELARIVPDVLDEDYPVDQSMWFHPAEYLVRWGDAKGPAIDCRQPMLMFLELAAAGQFEEAVKVVEVAGRDGVRMWAAGMDWSPEKAWGEGVLALISLAIVNLGATGYSLTAPEYMFTEENEERPVYADIPEQEDSLFIPGYFFQKTEGDQ